MTQFLSTISLVQSQPLWIIWSRQLSSIFLQISQLLELQRNKSIRFQIFVFSPNLRRWGRWLWRCTRQKSRPLRSLTLISKYYATRIKFYYTIILNILKIMHYRQLFTNFMNSFNYLNYCQMSSQKLPTLKISKTLKLIKCPTKVLRSMDNREKKHLRNKSQSNKSSILTLCHLLWLSPFHEALLQCTRGALQETFMDRPNLKSNCDIGPEQIRYNVDRIAKYIQAKCFMILNSDDIVCVFYFI